MSENIDELESIRRKLAKKAFVELLRQETFLEIYREKKPGSGLSDYEVISLGVQLSNLNRNSGVISHLTFYTVVVVIYLVVGLIIGITVAQGM